MEEKGKKLGLWNIIGLGLGGAIGTGVFVLLGYGVAYTGRSISLVVTIGCFFMLLAYWYNLIMPSMFVLKGGDYSMKAMLFNPFMSGVSAWMILVNGLAMSSYAVALAQYLAIAVPALQNHQTLVAFIAITLFFLSTIKGSRFITILENIITLVLVASLALFIIFGIPKVDFASTFTSADGGFFHGGFTGFVSALAVMGFACQGTTMAPVSMAAVTKNPKRTIPLGIIIITLLLAVIYGAMGIVAGGVLPYAETAGQNISVTARAIFPNALYVFFVVGGGIGAIASSALGGLGMFRYPLLQVANDGWLPSVFKKTDKNGYPYAIYLLFYVISVFPIVTGRSLDAIVSQVIDSCHAHQHLHEPGLPDTAQEIPGAVGTAQHQDAPVVLQHLLRAGCFLRRCSCLQPVQGSDLQRCCVRSGHRGRSVRTEHPAPEAGRCQGRRSGRQERGDRPSGHCRYHC